MIPVYNHEHAIGIVVAASLPYGYPIILVDDGSAGSCAKVLDELIEKHLQLSLVRLARNQGKGGAVEAGLREAARLGYSHALQIDADGQHNCADIPVFSALAVKHPLAVICGCPIYDDSVPRARLYGRYATHIWVWINTLSLAIRDSMCGFRVYPLAPTVALLDDVRIGRRMDYDTEVLVRLYWRGLQIVNQPTKVCYPLDGVSHFRMLTDNLKITWMHTKLFFGMLPRAPLLIWRHLHN